jgi:hypothetical protein
VLISMRLSLSSRAEQTSERRSYNPTRFKIQLSSRHASTAVVAPATPNQIAFCGGGANCSRGPPRRRPAPG